MSEKLDNDYTSNVVYPDKFLGGVAVDDVGPMDDAPLNGGGGGGRFDGMTWQDAVRRVDDKVDSNFKWTVGVFGGGFLTLLAAFATGFLILLARIDTGNDKVITKLDALAAQVTALDKEAAVLKATTPPPRNGR